MSTTRDHPRSTAKLLRHLLLAACAAAVWTTGHAEAAPAAPHPAFGLVGELAGSCWRVDQHPGLEFCYRFDRTGRILSARMTHDGKCEADATIATSSLSGWLLETWRRPGQGVASQNYLKIMPTGALYRMPLNRYDEWTREYREPRSTVETLRRLDADRFEYAQEVRQGWTLKAIQSTVWTFTRVTGRDHAELLDCEG